MNLLRIFFSALLLYACCGSAFAADSLVVVASRPMAARRIYADELGNIYAIQKDNTFARYNAAGDSTGFYRSALNGQLGTADVSNPLRILLYFPAFNKIQILDRQLALLAEIDLRPLRFFSVSAVATASDGNIWVYDPVNARLVKLDETGARKLESNDLRELLSFVPRGTALLERDHRLYLSDTSKGILVFDQFATYITTLPFTQLRSVNVVGHQLVFLKGDTLQRYNMQDFQENELPLPKGDAPVLDARVTQRALVVLYADRLVVYGLPGAALR